MGIIDPVNAGFYVSNSYLLGANYPFIGKHSAYSTALIYRLSAFEKPSHDLQYTFYFWKGIRNYKLFAAGSLVLWAQNRDQGNDYTRGLPCKEPDVFGAPQIWMNLRGTA